ncbi:PAS domain S-box-containing protein/diguanylate cyclase (GGDEF)-like protein [Herbaspirillum sp. Sphag1AN]|uniref:two-component system response regulator n=1 Tax=unclassified Herbaspirillum TaxID=2624150 RepID=UPI00160D7A0B|nr:MULTISPECIES: EAL domain-containing protein [unclassified Herbaspirillum]MBB3213129.1 PAS domain S-box-containing protein/diguanylate cyclase (GGDEF)-like protein [Herbaspirillum sp. Sphag1AN]MBB3246326.1 PAS domain S-box-containing protein/diguanylate cyclase (GGDEF)-like protein [Herbaspirillum sp. Sphag64]
MRRNALKVLMIEDDPHDVELTRRELTRSGLTCEVQAVETEHELVTALVSFTPDVVLCDFSLPTFDGLSALVVARNVAPNTPFMFVSGTMGEERAIKALKNGAVDYILKSNLARLPSAVERALQEAHQKRIRQSMELALQDERNLLSAIFDTTGALGMMLDHQGRIMRFNQAAERTTGFSAEQVQGRYFWDMFFPADEVSARQEDFFSWRQQTTPLQYQSSWLTATGEQREILWLTTFLQQDAHAVLSYICSGIDITQWREAEDRLYRLSNYDESTGLPNRRLLRDRLDQDISRFQREKRGTCIAVMLVDIHDLLTLRESLGAGISGIALMEVSRRLTQLLSHEATLARFGDTCFALALPLQEQALSALWVQEIFNALDQPYTLDGHPAIYLASKMGVALYPDDGVHSEFLLEAAEIALHRAMEHPVERCQFYTPEFNSQVRERLQLVSQLRQAIEKDQLVLHYQPQLGLSNGAIVGVEALVRWQHPERGLVSPQHFIGIAEETGLILSIGEWVLRTACLQAIHWQQMGLPPLMMAVNLSAKQFSQDNLVMMIQNCLRDTGLAAQYLELELTESVSMESPEKSIGVMCNLKAMGVRLSIDDFGTGYSNLNYLKRFPVDQLKIDRSFVCDLATDADSVALVRSIIALGRSLHLEVLAEGVEEQAQMDIMRSHGCDKMQGYFLSKPLPAAGCTTLLQQHANRIRS